MNRTPIGITKFTTIRVSMILLVAVIVHTTIASAQTNRIVPKVSTSQSFLDFADQLELSPKQKQEAQELQGQIELTKQQLSKANATNTPPDVVREIRLDSARKLRMLKGQLTAILSDIQREKYAELRHLPASNYENTKNTETASENLISTEPSGLKVKIRPLLSDDKARQLAGELRQIYSDTPAHWPAPNLDETVKPYFVEIGLLPPVAYPTSNVYTDLKAELGKRLFFDPRLSGSGQIACASCHDPDLAWTDGRTVSFGHARKVLKRNAPMILNAGQLRTPFWDGRVNSLEEQAMAVLNNEDEMRSGAELVQSRLLSIDGYTNQFATVFGSAEPTIGRVVQAIATFERTINSRANAFDNFLRGDTNALSDSAVRGLNLFRTTARCINCHNGPNFTDGRFHNEGLSYYGRKYEDLGRYIVTHQAEDVGRFKTPSLRNVSRTGPYMHNGLFELDGVLAMYNAGMPNLRPTPKQKDDPLFPKKSPLLKPLGLNSQDLADLKAFLESLTEAKFHVRPPESF